MELSDHQAGDLSIVYTNNMKNLLKGYKTYLGIAILAIGAFGLSDFVTQADVATVIDSILKIVGVALAVYGRYAATK